MQELPCGLRLLQLNELTQNGLEVLVPTEALVTSEVQMLQTHQNRHLKVK